MKIIRKSQQRQFEQQARRGAAMVFALIALLVAALLIGSTLRTAAMSHRQLKRDEYRAQACLLADAGCDRVLAILKKQPDFKTDEWNVPAEQLATGRKAVVHLSVEADSINSGNLLVTAVAEYPLDNPDLVRVTRKTTITISPEKQLLDSSTTGNR